MSSLSTCIFCIYTDFCSVGILQCCCNSKPLHPRDLTYSICLNIRQADSTPQNNEKLTYERKLFGGSGLQVHAVLQPEEFGIWDAISVAVEAGRYSWLLGLRLWIDQDHWRDWTHKHKQNQKRQTERRGERENIITHCFMVDHNSWGITAQTPTHAVGREEFVSTQRGIYSHITRIQELWGCFITA